MRYRWAILALLFLAIVLGFVVAAWRGGGGAPPIVAPGAKVPAVALPGDGAQEARPEGPSEGLGSRQEEDIAPPERRLIYGTVTDAETGSPLPGASVTLAVDRMPLPPSEETNPPYEASADASGAFELTVPPGDVTHVACASPDYIPASHPLPQGNWSRTRMDFQLLPGATVAGRVIDETTQKPITGAKVALSEVQDTVFDQFFAGFSPENPCQAETDEDGVYRITGVPAGSYRVTATARSAGYVGGEKSVAGLVVNEPKLYPGVVLALMPGTSVTGTITDALGSPINRVHVSAEPANFVEDMLVGANTLDATLFEELDDRADKDGRYTIAGLSPNRLYRLRGSSKNHAPAQSEPFRSGEPGSSVQVDLVLEKGCRVSGRALGADGRPAGGQRVWLSSESLSDEGNTHTFMASERTDAEGAFVIEHVAAGVHWVLAARESANPREPESGTRVEVDGVTDIRDVVVIVQEEGGGAIVGRVLTQGGAPAAGVVVEGYVYGISDAESKTDGEGRFTLTGLDDEPYDVTARCDAGTATQPEVQPGSTVTLRIEPWAELHGVVVNEAGQAVPDAEVTLGKTDEAAGGLGSMGALFELFEGGSNATCRASVDGAFSFKQVAAGKFTVQAKSPTAGEGESAPVTVQAGVRIMDLQVVMQAGVRFAGVVVDADGAPAQGTQIRLMPCREGDSVSDATAGLFGEMLPAGFQVAKAAALTDGSGAFEMVNVRPGEYRAVAAHPSLGTAVIGRLRLPAGRDVTRYRIVLQRPGRATGRYLIDGVPQAGMTLLLIGPGGVRTVTTDEEGRFLAEGLAPGSYLVNPFDLSESEIDMNRLMINPRVIEIAEGQTTEMDMGNASGVPVSGTLTGGDLRTTTMVVLRRSGDVQPADLDLGDIGSWLALARDVAGQAIVNPDGTFELNSVEPGTYVAEVYSADFASAQLDPGAAMEAAHAPLLRQRVTIEEGQPARLDLSVP